MKIIGHRGARGLAAENTLQSIEAALRSGVDGIEIDVRSTHDGMLVLSHDAYLADEDSKNQWKITQHSYDFLKKRFPELTTLREALHVIPEDKEARVEIKPGEPVDGLIEFLRQSERAKHGVMIVSFDMNILKAVHYHEPQIPLVLNESWSGVRAQLRAHKLETKHIQMNQRWLWLGFVRAIARAGYRLTPYTVNNPKQADRWAAYLDGIITDFPDRFTHGSA